MSSPDDLYCFKPFKLIKVQYRGQDVPRPRSGHRIECDESNVYCYGGYNPSLPAADLSIINNPTWTPERPLFKELWRFCISSCRWKLIKVSNMPNELASNATCMNGRYLMIFGGTGAPFGDKCSNDLITWRVGDDKLEIANVRGLRPPGQYGQSIVYSDGYLYTIGGTNGFAYNSDIYRLDLRKLKWDPVFVGTGQEDEPMGRYRHEVIKSGHKLYIIGGGTGEWAFELMEVPCFDLETNTWTLLTPKADDNIGPLPRKCHSAVHLDSSEGTQVFVVGGSDGVSKFADVWRLSIDTLQWTLMKKTVLPHKLYFHSSAITPNGCMYVFGGIEPQEDSDSSSRNNVMYKVWLCVPKLSEMCWEAMMNYFPDLEDRNEKDLRNIGIPVHLTERLKQ